MSLQTPYGFQLTSLRHGWLLTAIRNKRCSWLWLTAPPVCLEKWREEEKEEKEEERQKVGRRDNVSQTDYEINQHLKIKRWTVSSKNKRLFISFPNLPPVDPLKLFFIFYSCAIKLVYFATRKPLMISMKNLLFLCYAIVAADPPIINQEKTSINMNMMIQWKTRIEQYYSFRWNQFATYMEISISEEEKIFILLKIGCLLILGHAVYQFYTHIFNYLYGKFSKWKKQIKQD